MSFARRKKRKASKAEEKAKAKEQSYQNQIGRNVNTVTELLKRSEPIFKQEIRENVIRQVFAMSFLAMHDEFGFGEQRIMRWYKRMLTINHEIITSGSENPLKELIAVLNEEYSFDLDKAMQKVNQECDKEWGKSDCLDEKS